MKARTVIAAAFSIAVLRAGAAQAQETCAQEPMMSLPPEPESRVSGDTGGMCLPQSLMCEMPDEKKKPAFTPPPAPKRVRFSSWRIS